MQQWEAETKEGTGFKFNDLNRDSLSHTVMQALNLYRNDEDWDRIRHNAMKVRMS